MDALLWSVQTTVAKQLLFLQKNAPSSNPSVIEGCSFILYPPSSSFLYLHTKINIMHYFEFYNLPIRFELNETALRRQFLQLSKKYHPDFYTLESEEKQMEILELSTLNNEAYKVLKDADKRLHYILQLKGLLQEGKSSLPQAFLMEMMDFNETIMELQFDYDADRYQQLMKQLQTLRQDLHKTVAPLLANYDDAQASTDHLETIRDYYYKNRYLLRLTNNLDKVAQEGL